MFYFKDEKGLFGTNNMKCTADHNLIIFMSLKNKSWVDTQLADQKVYSSLYALKS